jgi:cytochrome c553
MSARMTLRAVLAAACLLMLIVLLPVGARAVSSSQRELQEVRRSAPSLDRVADLYSTCVMCHGAGGRGTLDGQVPRIAGQHATVLGKQLVDYRYDRRWDLACTVSRIATICLTHRPSQMWPPTSAVSIETFQSATET